MGAIVTTNEHARVGNIKFQNACAKKAQNVPPIWFMRQAGRYHRHYQKLRERYTFMQLCKEPELAAEVALGPVRDFDFDVAILFSDLLFPLEALGMKLAYNPAPQFESPLDAKMFKRLRGVDEAAKHLEFQKRAMQLTRETLPNEKSLIGFVGGPWTLFNYATGANIADRGLFIKFSLVMLELLKRNIALQLEGGAEIVMIFDTSAGELDPVLFDELVCPGIQELAGMFPHRLGYYSKQTQMHHISKFFIETNLAGIGLDHHWDLSAALRDKHAGFIQGNFNQSLMLLEPSEFEKQLQKWLAPLCEMRAEDRAGWVCGLGHGVLPKTPEENVRRFVQKVREAFSK